MDEARARGYDKIDLILLVGGSTRMPQVSARLEAEFQLPIRLFDPDEAVAKGAALYGHKLLLDQSVQHKKSKATTGQQAKETQGQPVESQARAEQVRAEEAAQQPAVPRSRPAQARAEKLAALPAIPQPSPAKTRAEKLAEQPTASQPTPAFSPGGEEEKERAASLVLPTDLAANRMVERLNKTTITNVTSHSFGIIVTIGQNTPQCRQVIENLVVVNDPLPSLRVHTYGTLEANQEQVEVRIIENTEKTPIVEMDRYAPEAEIGKVVLPLPPGLPRHAPIDVTFELNQQGRLHVVGYEPRSKTQVEATFESGMSAQEVSEARSHSLQLTII
jgi:molecular chaperone DnaK (HSP70)